MHVLDNPIWASLASRHRELAAREGAAARYPADVAPFAGVEADTVPAAALDALLAPGESLYLLGTAPVDAAPARLAFEAQLAQMVCEAPIAPPEGPLPEIVPLGEAQRADVLALTARVYPHYFRPRTMALGRYFGIYRDGQLAAMIGERMGMDGWQEISAVCTHPDHLGRGYARHLLAWLTNDNLARGRLAFLHVSHANTRAKTLYAQCGYRLRRDIPFWRYRA
ncbi:GNAT family N-acetyltransferase [Vulcaniibacterium thermophilum]|uniref:N-acetyltransferase domain-containing protein n=1 Tax=Vulcaniibacterium thermophilum TaxID=1169913 RepID=A0A918Z131_9GAMM|nr:GNAT family N-acetyltransferase [Vulcaniibacterium thermophilum]GHE32454.1 hypothetical protein GCM10007167_12980 [Vulcaniibacterium thermophilum]